MGRLRVLTWHVHGNYMLYLSQTNVDFFLPLKPGRPPGYRGRGTTFPFGDNVHEVPAAEVRNLGLDCILFQHRLNYTDHQYEILSEEQLRLPRIYLEHDPPQEHPTNTRHLVDDRNTLLVHVTPFNALMWDSGPTPTRVIDHGIFVPDGLQYLGEKERGLVVVNNMRKRGRRLGLDIFEQVREEVPLDLVGLDAESIGGLGEIAPMDLAAFEVQYRFFFHPIRYTSLGLAVLEAMMLGLPIIGLATTELATVIQNGVSGYIGTNLASLKDAMRHLLADPGEAHRLGANARRHAMERFHISRFVRDWEEAFTQVCSKRRSVGRSRHHEMVGGGTS